MSLDVNEVAALFHIHKEASAHGNSFVNIKNAAWDKLKALDADHGPQKESGDMDPGPQVTAEASPPSADDASKTESIGDMSPGPITRRTSEPPAADDPSKQGSG